MPEHSSIQLGNTLVYGKSDLQHVVSIEPGPNGQVEIFIEEPNGTIRSTIEDNSLFWFLTTNQSKSLVEQRLQGNQHYKYIVPFKNKEEYYQGLQFYRRMNKDVFTVYDPKEMNMLLTGITYFKGLKQQDISILSFDIETTSLDPEMPNSQILLISNTFRKQGKLERKLFAYNDYSSPKEMLMDWCKWVYRHNPSIICGHNIFGFDLPYMHAIAKKEGIALYLGRDKSPASFNERESRFRKDQSQFLHYHKCHVYGRELIDTMFLAIKYDIATKKYESYGLKQIIKQEGLQVKGRVFYDAAEIRFKYNNPDEWEKIKQYALHDADDALALYDLMSPPFFYMTQSIPKAYQTVIESASGSQLNSIMIRNYLQEAHSIPRASEINDFEGAISFGNPGIYQNAFKIDVGSLYPSIMREYKVYPTDKDPKQYFMHILNYFTEERLKHKKLAKDTGDKYHDDLQSAFKIFINSLYGFLGASGLNFNSQEKAAFVTEKGREILNLSIKWAQDKSFYVINGDTDSIMFNKPDGSLFSSEEQAELLKDINSLFPSMIKWEHDGIYPKVIIVKAKNYVLYDGKKIKYKGSALKATTLEPALQEFIKRLLQEILDGQTNHIPLYYEYVKEICNIKDIKRWAVRKTLTDKTFNSQRANETKIKTALENSEYVEGDRAYFFFRPDDSLCLVEHFDGNYNKHKLLEKLFKATLRFEHVLQVKELFKNFKLKRNQEELNEVQKAGT